MRRLDQIQELLRGAEPTESEASLLALMEARRSVPIEELQTSLANLKGLIEKGHLVLVAASYPWGIQFTIELSSITQRVHTQYRDQSSIGQSIKLSAPRCHSKT